MACALMECLVVVSMGFWVGMACYCYSCSIFLARSVPITFFFNSLT